MNGNPIVTIRNLCKSFGLTRALEDVSLDIEPGLIIGLLGPNGSGKSTLLRHIIGLYLPDSGQCTTFGCEAGKLGPQQLGRIGYVHQEGELLDWMTVEQLIRYVSAYYPNWDHALEEKFIGETEIRASKRVGALSPGQRQQLAILLAIGFGPELLILDEPAAALDPVARGEFLDLLLQMIQTPNRTIIISSHILSDVEKVIDHALIMKSGRIIRNSSFDDLREEFCRIRVTSLTGGLPEQLPFRNVVDSECDETQAWLTLKNPGPEALQSTAETLNCELEVLPLSLEEIYRVVVRIRKGERQ